MALTSEQIDNLEILTMQTVNRLTDWILRDICRRIAEAGKFTSAAEYQTWRLKSLGMKEKEIKKEISKRLQITQEEIDKLIEKAAKDSYENDITRLSATEALEFKDNKQLQQILSAAKSLANSQFSNITQTMGFVAPNGKVSKLTQAYQKCCDFANLQITTGATDYNTAIKNATRNLLHYGVRSIDYASGIDRSVEAAVRGAVFGGIGLMQEQISQENHDTLGADGWEISAHRMSAPDHEPFQGRQYTDRQYQTINNLLKRRIGTLNCKHIAFPIRYGITPRAYTDEQLKQWKQENKQGIQYNDKSYKLYEATQKQRSIERTIRQQKRNILVADAIFKATGNDEQLKIQKTKLTLLQQEYNNFSNVAGLQPQYNRTNIGVNV
jgi:hypothetical protein